MTRYTPLLAALLLAVPAAAQDSAEPGGEATAAATPDAEPLPDLINSRSDPQDFDLARKKVVDCAGEKFIFSWGAGARPTKVTLCSKENATPDEVVQMLDEAATKLEGTASIAEDRRIAIVKQIRAKIAEVKATSGASAPPPALAGIRANVPATTAAPPSAYPVSQVPVAPVYTPKPVQVASRPLLGPKPKLTFECYTPGDIGSGGPCTTLGRDTRLTVKAGEPLVGGTTLRFRRNGETRAEVALSDMRKGQSVRLVMPQQVCGGVVEAEVEIQVDRRGSPIDERGPYLLRC